MNATELLTLTNERGSHPGPLVTIGSAALAFQVLALGAILLFGEPNIHGDPLLIVIVAAFLVTLIAAPVAVAYAVVLVWRWNRGETVSRSEMALTVIYLLQGLGAALSVLARP